MASDVELKPCPICGNRAFLSITGVPGHRSVWCLTELCLRMAPRETADEAIAAWNTRPTLPERDALREASWPCEAAVVNRDPVAVAKLVIKSGALEGPYIGGRKRPSRADVAFWDRVSAESERIAQWAVEGLGIIGRAALKGAEHHG